MADLPWWEVQRLITVWEDRRDEFDGVMGFRGLDPMDLPLRRFLNVFREWMLEGADKKQREDFMAQLRKPPAGVSADQIRRLPEWDPGAAGNDFMAQMAQRGGAGRTSRDGAKSVVA